MSDATTQEGVAGMSDAEMVNSLAAMFDAEMLPDDPKKGETAEKTEPTVDVASMNEIEAADDGEVSQETEAEQDTEIEAQAEQDELEADEAQSDDKWMPDSLTDLAEALEADPDTVAEKLKLKVKVDGVEGEATLKDVIKSYQLEHTLHERLKTQAEERKVFEEQAKQFQADYEQGVNDIKLTHQAYEQMLAEDYQSIDWNELKQTDPTEFMLKQQEIRDKFSRLESVKQEIGQKEAERVKAEQEKLTAHRAEYLNQQQKLLLDRMPEWADEKQRHADLETVVEYMRSLGSNDQEMQAIADHRIFIMAYEAARFRQMRDKAAPKQKQMKTKPRFVKPGARKDPATVSEKNRKTAFARAKKHQTDEAWAEALLASGKL